MARILIVDDEASVLHVLVRAVRGLGHECISTTCPRQALDAATTHLPELVITDLMMPGMDGVTLANQIYERLGEQAPPVLFVSALDDNPQQRAPNLRARFVQKPFDRQTLAKAIGALLRK